MIPMQEKVFSLDQPVLQEEHQELKLHLKLELEMMKMKIDLVVLINSK